VIVLETNLERGYFTNHGLHLNSSGKECIARKLAEIVTSSLKKEEATPISLPWKGDTSFSNQNGSESHAPSYIALAAPQSHLPTSPKKSPGRESQVPVASPNKKNEEEDTSVHPQLTKRQRNKPTPRNQDFLWTT